MEFRTLRADEIEARVKTVTEKGCQILLYKNARCDMKILDETVTPMNWQRDHKELKNNMYAGIGIWDEDKNIWIWKWDCGTESNTEGEKGEASDSFKRAGFNWGIGRELYTAPFIWFGKDKANISTNNQGKSTTHDTFKVTDIEYEDGKISYLKVIDNKTKEVFVSGRSQGLQEENLNDDISDQECKELLELIGKANVNMEALLGQYKVKAIKNITRVQYTALHNKLVKAVEGK